MDMKFATALMIALMSITPAMAIDFTQKLTNLDGSPVTDKDGKTLEHQPTLGSICQTALITQYADEVDPMTRKESVTPEEKFQRWKIAQKLEGSNVTLTAEELALIKKLVGKAYSPLIVGQAWTMLDPGEKK
jgi:hypothetical protein